MIERRGSRDWSAAAKAAWGLLFVVVGLPFSLGLAHNSFGPPKTLNDFVQEWSSARNYFAGEPIYAPLEESLSRHMGRRIELGVIDVNAHPPASVLVVLPLAKLPYDRALQIWNAVSLAALAVSLMLLFGACGLDWSPWHLLPVLTLLVSSNPLGQQMLQGQLNLVLLLLVTGAWAAARGQRWLLSGTLIGVAGAIKLVPLFLGLYYLCRRRPRGVAGVGLGFFAVNGLAAAVLGVECFEVFFREVAPQVAAEFQDYWPNASINGFFRKLLHGGSGHVVPLAELPQLAAALTAAGCLAVTALAARKTWRAETAGQQAAAFAACLIAMMLVSPITWDHYFLILLPALCWLWELSAGRHGRKTLLLLLIVLLFTVRPRWIWDAAIPGDGELALRPGQQTSVAVPWHAATVLAYQFYGLLALLVIALRSGATGEAAERGGERQAAATEAAGEPSPPS